MENITKDDISNILDSVSKTFEERSAEYGNAHEVHAKVLCSMFPNGIYLDCEDSFSRFATFNMCVAKLTRYAMTFSEGGHKDSAHDLISYSAMLEAKTDEK